MYVWVGVLQLIRKKTSLVTLNQEVIDSTNYLGINSLYSFFPTAMLTISLFTHRLQNSSTFKTVTINHIH
jgi:hypothetical protein